MLMTLICLENIFNWSYLTLIGLDYALVSVRMLQRTESRVNVEESKRRECEQTLALMRDLNNATLI